MGRPRKHPDLKVDKTGISFEPADTAFLDAQYPDMIRTEQVRAAIADARRLKHYIANTQGTSK